MNEKIYKTMKSVGSGNIAIGILMIVVGTVCGIMTIIGGASLLKNKKNVMF